MSESQRTKDKRIRDRQRFENHAYRGMVTILKRILDEVTVYSTAPRHICPLCDCLLFESDNTCPGCRAALLAKEVNHGAVA